MSSQRRLGPNQNREIMKRALFIIIAVTLTACTTHKKQSELPALIPIPSSVEIGDGAFELNDQTLIVVSETNEEHQKIAHYLKDEIKNNTGLDLEIAHSGRKNFIMLEAQDTENSLFSIEQVDIAPELYQLDVNKNNIRLSATTSEGLFRGIQTLTQLIPIEFEGLIPAVHIEDQPRFAWRGLMLDVSRHFFTVDEVKSYIDQMAKYKFNIFHWHLTDDQGWRIEIKSLPKLTEVGAWRVPRTGPWWTYDPPQKNEEATVGGFYTQEEIKEVVQYAADRYIEIVPEIDVPGHSIAMIAAYPHLSSTELPYTVNPGSRFYTIEDNALDPSKEEVYEVMDKVFTEVAELFPFEYIHIGGDECYKGFWTKDKSCQELMKKEGMTHVNELQSYFIKRMEKILQSKGKKLIGWDEILEGGLAPEATVMSWRGMEGGIKAAEMRHQVVMTPTTHCYLDLYQGDPLVEPITYSMLRLSDVYRFEPVPEGIDEKLILGGQGNLWTESVYTLGHAQYMTWPRGFALAEVLWSEKENQEWGGFVERTLEHFERLDEVGVNYAVSAFEPQVRLEAYGLGLEAEAKVKERVNSNEGRYQVVMEFEVEGLSVYYTFDDSFPDEEYPVYVGPVEVPSGAVCIRVVTYLEGKQVGKQQRYEIEDLIARK